MGDCPENHPTCIDDSESWKGLTKHITLTGGKMHRTFPQFQVSGALALCCFCPSIQILCQHTKVKENNGNSNRPHLVPLLSSFLSFTTDEVVRRG